MRFQPKTEEEIKQGNLLADGKYGFVISGATEKVSKIKSDGTGGNEMIEVTVRVYKDDGGFVLITDFLMEQMAFKLRHACEACGLLPAYEAGELSADDFVGKEGYVKIKTQKGGLKDKNDPNGERYDDRNAIADYIVGEDFKAPKDNLNKALDGDELEDKIPW